MPLSLAKLRIFPRVRPRRPGDAEGHVLIGFGPYKHMSRFDLYHSPQDEHRKYVRSILQVTVTHPGGQMDKLKSYIQAQQRRQQEKADDELLVQFADQLEQSLGLPTSASVSTQDLHVPPPPPDVTASVHSKVSSSPQKLVLRVFGFTVLYNHMHRSHLECWGSNLFHCSLVQLKH